MATADSTKGMRTFGARAWTLAELFARSQVTPVSGALPSVPITSLTDDSRKVTPGSCFVAVRGVGVDGHDYIEAAVRAGAAVVVHDREPCAGLTGTKGRRDKGTRGNVKTSKRRNVETTLVDGERTDGGALGGRSERVLVRVADSREALARLAATWFGLRDGGGTAMAAQAPFRLVGVTGTNGKTTVAWLLRSIFREAGHKCALLGTVEYDLVGRRCPAPLTTPGAIDLCAHLAEAKEAGATFAALEVSSHALDQRRCDGLSFAAGVFTNLTGDHLDYHGDMDAYFAAKRRLFESLEPPAVAVVNLEDPRAAELIAACRTKVVTCAVHDARAGVCARAVHLDRTGARFELHHPAGACGVSLGLVGRHNVANALAAAATALALEINEHAVRGGLEAVRGVRGRLERAEPANWPFSVFVDYAHTDDALRNVLTAVRPITHGRVICVFGCGGNRDRTKRPRMAKAVEELADLAIVTSDNPRNENPHDIIDEIIRGFTDRRDGRVVVEPDRGAAIAAAMGFAQPGDAVLIAGKGHEDYQLVGDQVLAFDDVAVARECLRQLSGRAMEEVA